MNLKSNLPVAHGLINYQVLLWISRCSGQVSWQKGRNVVSHEKCLKPLCLKGLRSLGIDFLWGCEQIEVLYLVLFLVYQFKVSELLWVLKFHVSRLTFCFFFVLFSFLKNHGLEIKWLTILSVPPRTFS